MPEPVVLLIVATGALLGAATATPLASARGVASVSVWGGGA